MSKKPSKNQPELNADEPFLNELERLTLAGDKEAERSLNAILSDPEKLALLSSFRLPLNPEDQSEASIPQTKTMDINKYDKKKVDRKKVETFMRKFRKLCALQKLKKQLKNK